ncbi:hypothetical protein [Frankia sp. R82]|uniref:hypothetical protein n=1 Tax=Frankia sp. R82 TaxID=2950553 RepID=UPI00204394C8|nr:hypothetical protein [Frankia sp. R82]MCM3883017.1 hypothetical protein [Frankia sp. R82]
MCAVLARARLAVMAVTTGLLLVALVGCSNGAASVDEATAASRASAGSTRSPATGSASAEPTGSAAMGADGTGRAGSTPSPAPDGAGGVAGAGGTGAATGAVGAPGSAASAAPRASAAPGAPVGGAAAPSGGAGATSSGGSSAAGGGGASGSDTPDGVGAGGPTGPVPQPSAVFLGEACDPHRNTGSAAAINGLALYCTPDESSTVGGRWSTEPPSSGPSRPRQGSTCARADVGRIVRDQAGRPLTCLQDPNGSLSWSDVS